MKQKGQAWLGVAADWWRLGAEASLVVPLRLARLAFGGARAKAEVRLMISEKVGAHGALLHDLRRGKFGTRGADVAGGVVRHYLVRVRANRKRLLREFGS